MKKAKSRFVIIGVIIIVLILIILGYLYFTGFSKDDFRENHGNPERNLQLTDSQINEVTSFFDSNPTSQQIQDYCEKDRMNCAYYCRNINSDNDYCKQLNSIRKGNYSRDDPNKPGGMPKPLQ